MPYRYPFLNCCFLDGKVFIGFERARGVLSLGYGVWTVKGKGKGKGKGKERRGEGNVMMIPTMGEWMEGSK